MNKTIEIYWRSPVLQEVDDSLEHMRARFPFECSNIAVLCAPCILTIPVRQASKAAQCYGLPAPVPKER